ncbi:hypothetical protein EJ06DRAFT_519480 [Trichodelitschia bisporula]|uniref:HECT-type E3 ubiquitin transferase n=1 Tax=Trichodelitschia bisporula TaxID=703511 RepID=A0A6G1I6E9_9PEZI|nr:hypothetical protein EJ06DRAFT_519480 [Trichodelitschia bisporula]
MTPRPPFFGRQHSSSTSASHNSSRDVVPRSIAAPDLLHPDSYLSRGPQPWTGLDQGADHRHHRFHIRSPSGSLVPRFLGGKKKTRVSGIDVDEDDEDDGDDDPVTPNDVQRRCGSDGDVTDEYGFDLRPRKSHDRLGQLRKRSRDLPQDSFPCSTCGGLAFRPKDTPVNLYVCERCKCQTANPAEPAVDMDAVSEVAPLSARELYGVLKPCYTSYIQALQQAGQPDPATVTELVEMHFQSFVSYLISSYGSVDNLNASFGGTPPRPPPVARTKSEGALEALRPDFQRCPRKQDTLPTRPKMDHKNLLTGDIFDAASSLLNHDAKPPPDKPLRPPPSKAPVSPIKWPDLRAWYTCMLEFTAEKYAPNWLGPNYDVLHTYAAEIADAAAFIERAVLEVAEALLKPATLPPTSMDEARYLLVLLANPRLHCRRDTAARSDARPTRDPRARSKQASSTAAKGARVFALVLGKLAHLPAEVHTGMARSLSRYPTAEFRALADLLTGFVAERLTRLPKPPLRKHGGGTADARFPSESEELARIYGLVGAEGGPAARPPPEDWVLEVGLKVLSVLVHANDTFHHVGADGAVERGQLLPTTYFYASVLDVEGAVDVGAELKRWENKARFSLCQWPFLLSLGLKCRVLEYESRSKMIDHARREYYANESARWERERGALDFHLRVRRECIAEDSLRRISEAIGAAGDEMKKGLKIHFEGEKGIDAGGPRKEWFTLLVKELFDPAVGLFLYDPESHLCYFNPYSLEPSETYELVGAVLGLAIYNSTVLDVPFPSFVFQRLAAARPSSKTNLAAPGAWRPSLEALAQWRPTLARSLRQILAYEDDVRDLGLEFVAASERNGEYAEVELRPGGRTEAVTNRNRKEYVRAYVSLVLERGVKRQWEPFCRGFWNVCGGNALCLFRAEEIEQVIRGSEDLDVAVLRGAAVYKGWERGGRVLCTEEEAPACGRGEYGD